MGIIVKGRWHQNITFYWRGLWSAKWGVCKSLSFSPSCCLLYPLSLCEIFYHPCQLLHHRKKSILVLLSMRNIRWDYSHKSIQNKYYTYCILNEKAWMAMFIVIHLNRWESKNMVANAQRSQKEGFCYFQTILKLFLFSNPLLGLVKGLNWTMYFQNIVNRLCVKIVRHIV